ncbi:MAG: M23 family metallopeptidase [Clostridia bacterium]|nr:M23 family metallopeptidase [Clostridia bacterium]
MKRKTGKQLLLLLFLLFLLTLLQDFVRQRGQASLLKTDTCFTEAFREQVLIPELYQKLTEKEYSDGAFADLLTTSMLNGNFHPRQLSWDNQVYLRFKPQEYYDLCNCYLAIWKDLETFPIPSRKEREIAKEIYFEDTFGADRNFSGSRKHEGCDLFGRISRSGFYPVISMTSGVVEKIGWLPLGGYRIGIRSSHGGYFYYAHLAVYEKDFQIGENVEAGQILGYMGDTGYGEEGTSGKFPVHLHLGIYITPTKGQELSVNPYYVLQAMKKNAKKYTY